MNQIMQFLKSKRVLNGYPEILEHFIIKNVRLEKGCLSLLNAHLCSIGRFIYGFISYEKVQIINTFHHPPLSLVPDFG